MGRRRFSVEGNGSAYAYAYAYDPRCLKSDGRRWRCPMPALPNISYCVHHRSLSRRYAAVVSPEPDRGADLDPAADSDPENLNQPLNLLPRRKKKKRRGENGGDSEAAAVDSSSEKPILLVEKEDAGSDLEKLYPILDPLEANKKSEKGVDSQLAAVDRSSDQPSEAAEADPDLEIVSRTLDPIEANSNGNKRENGADSEPPIVNPSSVQPVVIALQVEANSVIGKSKRKQRSDKGVPRTPNKRKREKATDSGPRSEDLVRIGMRRPMERREGKDNSEKQIDVRKELPNGVMAISSNPVKNSSHVDQVIDKKIGLEVDEGNFPRRKFRSKNVAPEPVGVVKKFPRVLGRCGTAIRDCREGKTVNCIRNGNMTCMDIRAEDDAIEESTNGQNKSGKITNGDYFICQLVGVLKQLNWEQIFELEIEANTQGRGLAGVKLQVIEPSLEMQLKCTYCRASIVNLHRNCSKCHYKLCLSCCREIRGKTSPAGIEVCEYPEKGKACKDAAETSNGNEKELSSEVCLPMAHVQRDKNSDDSLSCPPSALGGCGDDILQIKFLMPFGGTQTPCTAEQNALSCDREGCTNSQ